MEEMGDFKEPGSPGCLTRVSLPLVLLLVSLGIFVLLVTTQVQVFRIYQSLQSDSKTKDQQTNHQMVALSQKQLQSELKEIQEQLAWMNASLASLCRPCSQNWEPFQNSCYLLSRTQTNWHASVSACQDQGAHLVIVNSGEEQRFLQYWSVRKDGRTWIGLSDHHNEDAWHWVDNSPLQLSFWVKGEPNNAGDEDCAELSTTGWNDIKCDAENYWVCEKPSVPCTSL